MWYIYVLLRSDNSFYCGITKSVQKRLKQHNGVIKGGAKYTRSRRPCRVLYIEKAPNRSGASKKECLFKKLSRKDKEKFLLNKNVNYSPDSSSDGSTLSSHSSPSSSESGSHTGSTSGRGSSHPSSD